MEMCSFLGHPVVSLDTSGVGFAAGLPLELAYETHLCGTILVVPFVVEFLAGPEIQTLLFATPVIRFSYSPVGVR